jgi:dTDP-4-dehydrorhamnose reductase
MKVLVIGYQGMLAHELRPCLTHAGCTVVGRGRPDVDITQATSIRRTLADVQPDILINAAAYTSVEKAESEPDVVFAVNRDGAGHVAAACRDVGVPLIHVSTDYVFDGSASRPYGEEDRIAPLGMYGQSKWEGEEAVRSCHREHVIVRTAWLYGRHGQSFVKTMLRLAREREVLRVVDDQRGCPTWSRDLAKALATICQRIMQGGNLEPWGTYHFCGAGQTTWHGFAQAIFEEALAFEPLKVREVVPIPTTAYPTPAQRPAYSVLDCAKIQSVFGIMSRPWRESLHDYIQEFYTCTPIPLVTS